MAPGEKTTYVSSDQLQTPADVHTFGTTILTIRSSVKKEPSEDSVSGSAFLPASTGAQEERKPDVFIQVLVNPSGKFDAAKFGNQLYLVGQLKDELSTYSSYAIAFRQSVLTSR